MAQPRTTLEPFLALTAALCLLSGISSVFAMPPMNTAAHGSRIAIGHRTTWITTPLDRYGLPDYVAALNSEFSQGVSEKENAAIPLIQLRLGEGDVKGCLRYLSATRRLININSLLPDEIDRIMTGGSITELLIPAERALLHYPGLSAGDAQDYLRTLHNTPLRLPHLPLQQDCFRFTWLDYMITFYRRAEHIGPQPHYSRKHPVNLGNPFPPLLMDPPRGINWNWQFRQINTLISLYLFAEDWKASPFNVTHHSPLYTFAARLKHLEMERPSPAAAANPNKAFRDALVSSIFPAMGVDAFTVLRRLERCKEAGRLDDIAFALAAYHVANGKYPDQLSALCPKYLRQVPDNLLAPGPPEYQHRTNSYTLIANEPHGNKHDPKQYWRTLRNHHLVLQSPPHNPLVLHRNVVFL